MIFRYKSFTNNGHSRKLCNGKEERIREKKEWKKDREKERENERKKREKER